MCHINSVHEATENKEDKIAVVLYWDEMPIIHFVNLTKEELVDNTLGHWSSRFRFRFIRYIDKSEFDDIMKIFAEYRRELGRWLPWYVRWFSDVRG
ncbi:MAG: hypothetical protein ACTSW1_08465 [Candidatus Hodarchaeales archaeon]